MKFSELLPQRKLESSHKLSMQLDAKLRWPDTPFSQGRVTYAWIGLFLLYLPLCYFALYQEWGLDFYSYYQASEVLSHGGIPYKNAMTYADSWGQAQGVPANPNPPITLSLFSFFTQWGYLPTFFIWLSFSTILGVTGAYKTLQTICPRLCQQKEMSLFFLFYFSAYPILMNTIMLQFGGCLLFFVAMGYEAYLKNQDGWTGFWWGSLIALKLFPGLLLIYALLKKRYELFAWMSGWAMLFSLLPMLFLGGAVYTAYVQAVAHKIFWYGVNWNMSILGYLYRVCVTVVMNPANKDYMPIAGLGFTTWVFMGSALGIVGAWMYYFTRIEQKDSHRGFAMVLVLMILLSPFGWLYYLPMLLLPLICCFNDALHSPSRMTLWFMSLFCLCFPLPVTHAIFMPTLLGKLGIYSLHFYGLLILTFLTCTLTRNPDNLSLKALPLVVKQGMIGVMSFGLLMVVMRCGVFVLRALIF